MIFWAYIVNCDNSTRECFLMILCIHLMWHFTAWAYTLDVADSRRPLLIPKRTLILVDYKRKTRLSIESLKSEIKFIKSSLEALTQTNNFE